MVSESRVSTFFANRTRVSANLATIFAGAGLFAIFFSLTGYMQDVRHYSALKTGLASGPFGLMLFAGLGATTKILPRFGVRNGLVFSHLVSAAQNTSRQLGGSLGLAVLVAVAIRHTMSQAAAKQLRDGRPDADLCPGAAYVGLAVCPCRFGFCGCRQARR